MKHNKTGTIFMVSILALAGIGISYAGFSDSISVYGTVDTATVDIDWIGWFSGTWVYKIYDFETIPSSPPGNPYKYDLDEEILIYKGYTTLQPTESQVKAWATGNNGIAELISWSYAEDGDYIFPDPEKTESDIDMVYHNLFPCIDFSADFIFHYTGTIPAKIDTAQIFPILYDINYPDSEELAALWGIYKTNPAAGFGMWVEAYFAQGYDEAGAPTDDVTKIVKWELGEPVDVGTQLHACDYVYVKLTIHLPQDNYWQGLHGAFGGKISVIQWHDPCPNPD